MKTQSEVQIKSNYSGFVEIRYNLLAVKYENAYFCMFYSVSSFDPAEYIVVSPMGDSLTSH
jgi:hypothetical protein